MAAFAQDVCWVPRTLSLRVLCFSCSLFTSCGETRSICLHLCQYIFPQTQRFFQEYRLSLQICEIPSVPVEVGLGPGTYPFLRELLLTAPSEANGPSSAPESLSTLPQNCNHILLASFFLLSPLW